MEWVLSSRAPDALYTLLSLSHTHTCSLRASARRSLVRATVLFTVSTSTSHRLSLCGPPHHHTSAHAAQSLPRSLRASSRWSARALTHETAQQPPKPYPEASEARGGGLGRTRTAADTAEGAEPLSSAVHAEKTQSMMDRVDTSRCDSSRSTVIARCCGDVAQMSAAVCTSVC
jgi:hypothetical protein